MQRFRDSNHLNPRNYSNHKPLSTFTMKKLLVVTLTSLLLVACGCKDDSAKGAPGAKGGNGGKSGGAQRVLNVEGYVAEAPVFSSVLPNCEVRPNSLTISASCVGRVLLRACLPTSNSSIVMYVVCRFVSGMQN